MELLGALAAGFVLDLILGDPRWGLVHPVVVIGWFITAIKERIWRILYGCSYKVMRRKIKQKKIKRRPLAEKISGFVLTFLIVEGTFIVVWQILNFAEMIHPAVKFVVETYFVYKILATKSLKTESMKVYQKLKENDLEGARKELSYLVGRDTMELDEREVAKADVETIAENTADGVIAPMLYIALGGIPFGLTYKAINTLDSMVGYRNAEFKYIGFASAKLDDIFNYIPSRLAAGLMIAASAILRLDWKEALRIFKRDRYNHLSPNSAQTESVAAGALGIRLGGTHTYFGKPVEKPTIGDDTREVTPEDIKKTNQLLYVSAGLNLVVCLMIAAVIYILIL